MTLCVTVDQEIILVWYFDRWFSANCHHLIHFLFLFGDLHILRVEMADAFAVPGHTGTKDLSYWRVVVSIKEATLRAVEVTGSAKADVFEVYVLDCVLLLSLIELLAIFLKDFKSCFKGYQFGLPLCINYAHCPVVFSQELVCLLHILLLTLVIQCRGVRTDVD